MALRVVLGQQPVQERRGRYRRRAAEALNLLDAAGRIPLGHQVCRRPGQHRHQHAGDEPGRVGDGGGTELDIGLGVAKRRDQCTRASTVGVEGVHAAFRPRGGSRGVHDDERLVRAGRGGQFVAGTVGVGLQPLQGEHRVVRVGDALCGAVGPGDDDGEVWMFLAQTEIHVEIIELLERCRREHRPYPGVGRHISDFLATVDRHDGDSGDAEPRQRGKHLHELHPARQLHGGCVTGSQSLPVQTNGQPLGTVEKLPVRQRLCSVGREHLVGVLGHAPDQQIVECLGGP